MHFSIELKSIFNFTSAKEEFYNVSNMKIVYRNMYFLGDHILFFNYILSIFKKFLRLLGSNLSTLIAVPAKLFKHRVEHTEHSKQAEPL